MNARSPRSFYQLRRRIAPLGIVLSAALAQAQTPPDAGSQFSGEQRLQQRLPDRIPQIERAETARPALRDTRGERVTITRIYFSGAVDLVPAAELQAIVANALNKAHDFAGLEALAQRVTDHLKKSGYLLARAYLPRQDITAGELEIVILAGKLDSQNEPIKIVPGGKLALRIDPERLKAIAANALKAGEGTRDEDLQRAMLLMNDLPGISARARLEPGSEADTTRVVVDVEQAPLLTLTLSLDNYGNRYNGDARLVATVQADDPLGIGDRATLSLTEARHSTQYAFNYSLPLGSDGLRLRLSASQFDSQTMKEFAPLDIEAASDTLGIDLSYPLIRTRQRNLWATLAADRRRYLDTVRDQDVNDRESRPVSLSLSGDQIDSFIGGGFTQGGIAYVAGHLDLNLPLVSAGDALTANSAGHYDKWTWNLTRLQRIDGALTLILAANGQAAGKNLDSSEKFSLGGPTGVRAYPVSEALGDEGFVSTLELRYELPGGSLGQWQLSGFYDYGHITLHKDPWSGSVTNATGSNTYGLGGYGLGVSLAKNGSHSIRFAIAHRTGDNPGRSTTDKDSDGLNEHTRAWLQALFWF
jgi:hemolysin activation/secretion protein